MRTISGEKGYFRRTKPKDLNPTPFPLSYFPIHRVYGLHLCITLLLFSLLLSDLKVVTLKFIDKIPDRAKVLLGLVPDAWLRSRPFVRPLTARRYHRSLADSGEDVYLAAVVLEVVEGHVRVEAVGEVELVDGPHPDEVADLRHQRRPRNGPVVSPCLPDHSRCDLYVSFSGARDPASALR